MLHICCVLVGTKYTPDYVEKLYDMVRRNLPPSTVGEFVVFTDSDYGFSPGIQARPAPTEPRRKIEGWWTKLLLHRPGIFPPGDRVWYFDLDTLITGPLDDLMSYDGPFAILRDFNRPHGLQSAVMTWTAGETEEIWRGWHDAGCPQNLAGGDQEWIERCEVQEAFDFTRLQDVFREAFVSYKGSRGQPPAKASVVVFHGHPRPHEVLGGWVPQVWKVDGISRAALTSICNTAADVITGNVMVNIEAQRDRDWFQGSLAHDRRVAIVGGGPSLDTQLDQLREFAGQGVRIWALNDVAGYLDRHQIPVDVQVICDARPEMLEVAHRAPADCLQLFASQVDPLLFALCDKAIMWHCNTPEVFELLKHDRKHAIELVGGGSTVGLQAIALAEAAGYRTIHLFGFDSCHRVEFTDIGGKYVRASHHAYNQPLNDGEKAHKAWFMGREWLVSGWMVQQAEEFRSLMLDMVQRDILFSVHCPDTLIEAVARDIMATSQVTPPMIRAHEVLKRLPDRAEVYGAEIGVFAGAMSRCLLDHPGVHLYMVDSWEGEGAAYRGETGDWHAGLSDQSQEHFFQVAAQVAKEHYPRAKILRGRSTDAVEHVRDDLDFVFIDADHSYEGCKADLLAWSNKVRGGGLLCGHDYDNKDFPLFGVKRAVDEYAKSAGLTVELGDHYTWFIRLPPPRAMQAA